MLNLNRRSLLRGLPILGAATVIPTMGSFAQAPTSMKFMIAADSSSGTYMAMLAQIIKVCQETNPELNIVAADGKNETPAITHGAIGNLDAVKNGEVHAGFLHSDIIYFYSRSNPDYMKLYTLVALYPEEIHVVARRDSGLKAGGTNLGIGTYGAKDVVFESLSDLKNFKVGAAGGSFLTARILSGEGRGDFDVVGFDKGSDVLSALDRGEIQAAIFVGGAPLANIKALSPDKYKLLPIGDKIGTLVSNIYRKQTINYPNLNSDNVLTLAPMATVVTNKFTRPKLVAVQVAFRKGLADNLEELQQTPGYHPKWKAVVPGDHGVWQWLDLPGDPTPKQ
jgi:TRAP-type uncharacterized transport system substrate-binding protein